MISTIYRVADQDGEVYYSSIAKAARGAGEHFGDVTATEADILKGARAAFKKGSYYGVEGHYLGIEMIDVL
jgi:hypothetical protein